MAKKTRKTTKRSTPEQIAVAMFNRGARAAEIKQRTGLPYWMVKGFAIANVIAKVR